MIPLLARIARGVVEGSTDPNYNLVTFHLPGENNLLDASNTEAALTAYGTVALSSSQAKFGTNSIYFAGTNSDYIAANSVLAEHELSSSDFTLEGWIYPTNLSDLRFVISKTPSSTAAGWALYISAGVLTFAGDSVGGTWQTATHPTSLTINTWHHVAVCKSGSSVTVFLDGVANTPVTFTGISTSAVALLIGKDPAFTRPFAGYMEDLRLTKGLARYSSTFTPPTSQFPTS